jgi:hypothetical protein
MLTPNLIFLIFFYLYRLINFPALYRDGLSHLNGNNVILLVIDINNICNRIYLIILIIFLYRLIVFFKILNNIFNFIYFLLIYMYFTKSINFIIF